METNVRRQLGRGKLARVTTRPIDNGWAPGAHRPRLAPGAVHVWSADLSAASDELLDWLSPSERERAARFPRQRDGLLWARARGILRALLGRYLELEPSTVEFRVEEHGRPTLAAPARAACISFNTSHSGSLALYAMSRAGAVGVDVQAARARRVNEPAIAGRAFGALEGRRLAALEGEVRQREFLRAWTRHEAALKCGGAGIWGRGRTTGAAMRCGAEEPWIMELEVSATAAAALAVEKRPSAVRRFTWQA